MFLSWQGLQCCFCDTSLIGGARSQQNGPNTAVERHSRVILRQESRYRENTYCYQVQYILLIYFVYQVGVEVDDTENRK